MTVVFAGVLLAIGNSVTLKIISADAVNYVFVTLFILLMALSAFPYASLFARRMHDLGYSGWWALILLVPLVGGLGGIDIHRIQIMAAAMWTKAA